MDQTQLPTEPASAPEYPGQVPVSTSNVAPVPVSPGSPGDVSQGLSQDEMKANLQDLMSKIQGKYQEFGSAQEEAKAGLDTQKELTLNEIFDLLKKLGIDPSNVEEVNAFLEKIKETNPELYQQIEKSLETLMGGDVTQGAEGVPPQTTGEMPAENMNINTNEASQQNL